MRAWWIVGLVLSSACGGAPTPPLPPGPPTVEMAESYTRLRSSFVVLRCLGERYGTGFGFGRPGRVATAAHVAQCPRELTAELSDGTLIGVRVVAVGSAHDIALLELVGPRAAEVEPIPVREDPLPVGAEVSSVGFPIGPEDDGPHDFTVTSGILAQRTRDRLIHDAAISPGSSGSPVLDREGQVVGVSFAIPRGSSVGIAVPIEHLLELHRQTPANASDPRDPFEIGVELGIDYSAADRFPFHLLGAELVGWASAFDQIVGTFHALIVGRLPRLMEDGSVMTGYRWAVELDFAYRLRIDRFPLAFEIGAGFSLGFDHIEETQQEIMLDDPTCSPATMRCAIRTFTRSTASEEFLPRPLLTLRVVQLGPLSLTYTVLFDVEQIERTEHRFALRLRLL